ncbi:MAG TPA: zinc ribbon domain-containing protein [Acidimicrobiia bacterium]|nr:zinc ribbon domain-containing protein [Acidimicrobiia bacterium]
MDPLLPEPAARRDNIISVSSDGNYEEFNLDNPPREESPRGRATSDRGSVSCPSCGASNPPSNRHCQECGARLRQGPLPTAPRPAVQATAGVRAALAISALLFGVVVIALLFNVFNGEAATSSTTLAETSTTSAAVQEPGPIEPIGVDCAPPGIGSFICDNLITGTADEYQITFEDLAEGDNIVIRLTFREGMTVNRIDWSNIEDPTRFKQNYRAHGIVINAEDAITTFPVQLEDVSGTTEIPFAAIDADWIEITIESAYTAEVNEGNVFTELAIQEITVIGYPSTAEG